MMEENKEIIKENKKAKKEKKPKKAKLIKNELLFRKGGYSVAIIAIILAAIILINWLVGTLSKRFNLEIDMSSQKSNSVSEENIDYIKKIDKDVSVTVCANEDDYASYMEYYGQNQYNATGDNASEYFSQTLKLVKKYADINDKISVSFVDPQTTEFSKISSKYTDIKSYGDIIVSATLGETERHKIVGFEDIYELYDESGYASSGYGSYTISGNKIETALTGAISYVVSSDSKKLAMLTGHSGGTADEALAKLLTDNNYEVETVSETLITSVSADYDAVVIAAPTKDFAGSELDALSKYLENDGKYNKGLLYFASASNAVLTNLNGWLGEWGIDIAGGVLFETDENNHMPDDPTAIGLYPGDDDLTADAEICLSGNNVPMTVGKASNASVAVTSLIDTTDSVVVAPVGASATYKDYKEKDKGTFSAAIRAELRGYDNDNNEITSYVFAFSSIELVDSQWAEYSNFSNKDIVLKCNDVAAHTQDSGISFVSKTITNESFSDKVTAAKANVIMIIFMILLPLVMIVSGIVIFVRRKNAQ